MINFFRKIRKGLLAESRISKYLIYAGGEIVLVMIGILLALQVNNWNEARKTRNSEVIYLNNIKSDLQLSIIELEEFIDDRKSQINSANIVMQHYMGTPVEDWNAFNKHIVDIYTWNRFYMIDNTFQELQNSGNFAIISNDSIKHGLLNLSLLYDKLKYKEDHWRHDAEQTLHPGQYEKADIHSISQNYLYQVTNGQLGLLGKLTEESFGDMLNDQKQKNGFAFAIHNFAGMNLSFNQMHEKCQELISHIDEDLGLHAFNDN